MRNEVEGMKRRKQKDVEIEGGLAVVKDRKELH